MNKGKFLGFTLFELLFTCALVCVLFTASLTFMWDFPLFSAQKNATKVFHFLQLARTEAIKQNQSVYVCATHNFSECSLQQAKGLMLYIISPDSLTNRTTLFRLSLSSLHELTFVSSEKKYLAFHPSGQSATPGTILIATAKDTTKIVISASGRIRFAC